MLRFSKGYSCYNFYLISNKFDGKYANQGEIQTITFSGDLPKFKNTRHFYYLFDDKPPQLHCHEPSTYLGFSWQNVKQSVKAPGPLIFVFVIINIGPYAFQKRHLSVFARFLPNFMINIVAMGKYRLLLFYRSAKNVKHFDFLLTQDHMGQKTLVRLQFSSDFIQSL